MHLTLRSQIEHESSITTQAFQLDRGQDLNPHEYHSATEWDVDNVDTLQLSNVPKLRVFRNKAVFGLDGNITLLRQANVELAVIEFGHLIFVVRSEETRGGDFSFAISDVHGKLITHAKGWFDEVDGVTNLFASSDSLLPPPAHGAVPLCVTASGLPTVRDPVKYPPGPSPQPEPQ